MQKKEADKRWLQIYTVDMLIVKLKNRKMVCVCVWEEALKRRREKKVKSCFLGDPLLISKMPLLFGFFWAFAAQF